MERSRLVEEDVSSSDESDPERHMGDNSGSTACNRESNLKNVLVLLGCDVHKNDGKVYMPNTKEMARLRRPERGQFKTGIKFNWTLTEEDVLEELRHHFPILSNDGR